MIQSTSLEAYHSISPEELGFMQRMIYSCIIRNPGMSNHDISRYSQIEINKVTPRVKELRDMGMVVFSHHKKDRITHRRCMCWKVK